MNSQKNQDNNINQTINMDSLKPKRSRGKLWFLLFLLIAGTISFLALKSENKKSETVQYQTQEAERGDITVIVTATGTLKPIKEVEVGSELSGIVKSVKVDYNDKVKTNQILATLDTSKLDTQVTQSRAALESAKAKLLQTEATLKETDNKLKQFQKVRELSDNKVPSQSEYDAAEASFMRAKADEASAKAAILQAEAVLKTNETDLSKSVIYSPINGIVLERNIEPGQTVAASFTAPVLFTLAEDLALMELHVDVDEADVGKIKDGQEATFTVDAYPDRVFNAKITKTRFNSQTVDGVVTYETVLRVDNADLSLRPGMTATADIIVEKYKDIVMVPNAALRFTMPETSTTKSSTSILGSILPRPPSQKTKQKEKSISTGSEQTLWILKNGQPVSAAVTIGATNGVATEIAKGDISEGMALIVEIISKGN